MKRSSVAPSLKLEQVDDRKLQEGGLNGLELRLGISSDNGLSGGATNPWLGVHPWSLAARQEKASLEQAHQRPNECAVQRGNGPAAAPQLVGWPPVRTFRKILSTSKPADVDELSKVKPSCEEDHGTGAARDERSTMYVKVNLEGYAVGRKIDLKAHRGYDELCRTLQSMFHFHGFLSDGYGRIATREDDDEQPEKGKVGPKRYILLYEDNEGDRMLVGDVPWELFVASVKRLYIARA